MTKKNLTEAKNIGGHAKAKDPWRHHAIAAVINSALRPKRHQVHHDVGQRFTFPQFARLEAEFRRELKRLFAGITPEVKPKGSPQKAGKAGKPSDYVPGKPAQYPHNRTVKAIFRKFYTEAFILGNKSIKGGFVGGRLDAEDKRWLESFLRKEFDYWKKFIEDVKRDRSKMDPKRRIEMYVQTLKTMYNTSRVLGSSVTALYYWETSPAEHCPHCLYLAAKSPFIKSNLPTVPASGDTQCKSNCKCHLRIEHPTVLRYRQVKRNAPTREELLRGMRALK
jgi:hypothetical protein